MFDEAPVAVSNPFFVRDCAFAAIATGEKAQTLAEFRDRLKIIPVDSIYHHFWQQSVETTLVQGSFYNDFSHWAHYHLHDDILAERLALIDPSQYYDLEKLRSDILDVLENRLDEQEGISWCLPANSFHFVRSKIVVFNTHYKMEHPRELVKTLPEVTRSSIFYHFIDARRRLEGGIDDFSQWLQGYHDEFTALIERLKNIDPYFLPLDDLQQKLILAVQDYFLENQEKA